MVLQHNSPYFAPCEGIIPSRSLWGYYTPHPFARVLHPRAPMLIVYNLFRRLSCQGIALKIFACKASKNFCALDNDDRLKSKHARSGFPLRALIVSLPAKHKTCWLSAIFGCRTRKHPCYRGPHKAAQQASTLRGEKEQPRASQRKAALSSGFLAV